VPVLDALHRLGKPFRFLSVNTKDTCIGDRIFVRFYLQFFDAQIKVQIAKIIQALLDVEVVSTNSPVEVVYGVCLDLELAKNYALPVVVDCPHGILVNFVDELVASFAGVSACVEVTAIADPNAVLGVQKFSYKEFAKIGFK